MKVYRYVDDYLVFLENSGYQGRVDDVLKVFREQGLGLKFTVELMSNRELQFLDLRLAFRDGHICWRYHRRAAKALLGFSSSHSKIIKNGIAFSVIRLSLFKSCTHGIQESFNQRVDRLAASGYPKYVIDAACQKLVPVVKSGMQRSREELGEEKKKICCDTVCA